MYRLLNCNDLLNLYQRTISFPWALITLILTRNTISCIIITYHILSYPILYYLILSCTILYYVIVDYTMLSSLILFYTTCNSRMYGLAVTYLIIILHHPTQTFNVRSTHSSETSSMVQVLFFKRIFVISAKILISDSLEYLK